MDVDLTFDNPLFEVDEIDPINLHDREEIDYKVWDSSVCTSVGT